MTSGEPDFTRRVRVMQHIAPDARFLAMGDQYGVTMSDEGTEGNAGDYSFWQSPAVADEAVIKDTGAESLKFTCKTPNDHGMAFRALSSSFLWGDLSQVTIKTYRPSGHFNGAIDRIGLLFQLAAAENSKGELAWIMISNDPADTWVEHTLYRGDFINHYGGLSNSQTVTTMTIFNSSYYSDAGDIVYIDAHNINAELGDPVAMLVDPLGHQQIDVLTLPALSAGANNIGDVDIASICALAAGTNNIGDVDIASICALAAGSNAIGSVDVDDVNTVALQHDQKVTAINTTDLITPGGSEKIQVKSIDIASATDDVVVKIWEEDNNGHMCFYANMLDGNIVSKNLIGANYLTSTNGKKLQCDLSKVAEVYLLIGYVLV